MIYSTLNSEYWLGFPVAFERLHSSPKIQSHVKYCTWSLNLKRPPVPMIKEDQYYRDWITSHKDCRIVGQPSCCTRSGKQARTDTTQTMRGTRMGLFEVVRKWRTKRENNSWVRWRCEKVVSIDSGSWEVGWYYGFLRRLNFDGVLKRFVYFCQPQSTSAIDVAGEEKVHESIEKYQNLQRFKHNVEC